MLKQMIIWNNLSLKEQKQVLQRPFQLDDASSVIKIRSIIEAVKLNGDKALREFTQVFDKIEIENFKVEEKEIEQAYFNVKKSTIKALKKVIKQLQNFHQKQTIPTIKVETAKGIYCENITRPISSVGLYVPGGNAPLISTVLMLGVPAQIADCPLKVLCSPPSTEGINPNILVAADLCGINKIYKLGGAQAIAAMAYGTETIPKVNKIFGPGNRWVTMAKMMVAQDVFGAQYDLPAGPSEVMVIADKNANVTFITADLLSQAEHDQNSQVILISTSKNLIDKVMKEIPKQISPLSRKSIIEQSMKSCRMIYVDSLNQAMDIANEYAPEHLILQIDSPRDYLDKLQSAASVFLGPWSPEVAGDYASGTNHVLPTSGFAKCLSGLSVRDFMKSITVQELTREGLLDIAESIRELSTIEGLSAHKAALNYRLQEDF